MVLTKAPGLLHSRMKEAFAKKNQDWVDECLRQAAQVGECAAVALVSIAKKRSPLDEEVQEFVSGLVDDPSAPARMRRLLGEMLMSPSPEKRARLAAVFAAGSTICPEPGDRDRLDALVERLFDDDVDALRHLAACDSPDGFLLEGPHGQAAIRGRRRFCPRGTRGGLDSLPTLSAVVLDNLESLGLIRSVGGFSELVGDDLAFLPYFMTPLGRFLQTSLQHEAIRAGMAVAYPESPPGS
jgi:hypothetical protein